MTDQEQSHTGRPLQLCACDVSERGQGSEEASRVVFILSREALVSIEPDPSPKPTGPGPAALAASGKTEACFSYPDRRHRGRGKAGELCARPRPPFADHQQYGAEREAEPDCESVLGGDRRVPARHADFNLLQHELCLYADSAMGARRDSGDYFHRLVLHVAADLCETPGLAALERAAFDT
uniref:Uncharacterized protein n=1 Tax=Panagrolaimus superbus TaxID=310955 RepID=A0A914YQR6_9BILA